VTGSRQDSHARGPSILEAAGQRTGLVGALGFFNGTTTRALGLA
jgi:hypothetical protein